MRPDQLYRCGGTETTNVAKSEKRQARPGAQLCLRVPPDARLGGYVRQEIIAFTEAHGIPDEEVVDFVSAVGEALANAVEHAHTSEPIEISAWLLNERLFAAVRDHGVGFASTERVQMTALPDVYAERGRGLPIMRRCSDIFSVRSEPGKGTCVTLGCDIHRIRSWRAQHAG
jgi:anti-sigma regulatory factor (Ser/Thr protein kinase)